MAHAVAMPTGRLDQLGRAARDGILLVMNVVIWGAVLTWDPPSPPALPHTGALDARPWLEQRAYWEAVTWRRARIARRFRGSPERLARYQAYMDSAYNPTHLLLGPNDDPYRQ